MTRVLICGGRDFNDRGSLYAALDWAHRHQPFQLVMHGRARGADHLADGWAVANFIPVLRFPANWGLYGNAAGAIRNAEMLKIGRPDLVIAFPGGPGTADMVAKARAAGVCIVQPSTFSVHNFNYGA